MPEHVPEAASVRVFFPCSACGKKLMAKFLCFFEELKKRGANRQPAIPLRRPGSVRCSPSTC